MHSRSSTADSADSYAAGRGFDSHDPLHHASSRSLGSLPSHGKQDNTEETRYGQLSPLARRNGPAAATGSAAISSQPPASTKDTTAAVSGPSPPPSTHLSGLMCNVHRTTGHEPPPLVGATTTILGDKLYVFGGRILSRSRPAPLTADLYELDLIRRHWSKLDAHGDIPPPRYFHSLCPLGDYMMVCYGGMSPVRDQYAAADPHQQPEVTVMSDIHIYNVQTKRWTYVPAQDAPQGRYAHCACILPSSAVFPTHREPLSGLRQSNALDTSDDDDGGTTDGTGGAEMVIVGGQDGANHYIEQINVFNLRSLQWTSTQPLGKSCGAYRSVATPLPPAVAGLLGQPKRDSLSRADAVPGLELDKPEGNLGSSMLIYSNYNFLDVKLELQVRASDGSLTERIMSGTYSPPGLRFPNGSVLDNHFVVSGTYLTSSKQEYALWALDLRSLTWSRIDAGGNVFSQGSWNRGVLWSRRNTFVILGDRKRSLVDDYNHRRINFTNLCLVELEAFGFYENPRKTSPMSDFVSASSPFPAAPTPNHHSLFYCSGGRQLSKAGEELGQAVLAMRELADMEILCVGGERLPANSWLLSHRWGPYFTHLLEEAAAANAEKNASAAGGPQPPDSSSTSSNSSGLAGNPLRTSITIKPPSGSRGPDDRPSTPQVSGGKVKLNVADDRAAVSSDSESIEERNEAPDPTTLPGAPSAPSAPLTHPIPPSIRPRCLYLPHTTHTVQALLNYFYTNALPPPQSPLCTPQILCSLLQIARPYRIDGLLEAVVERLHSVLDSRNAAAVFNATAMAAGGGRGVDGTLSRSGPHHRAHDPIDSPTSTSDFSLGGATVFETSSASSSADVGAEKGSVPVSAAFASRRPPSEEFTTNTTLSVSGSEQDSDRDRSNDGEEIWKGELSSVIGLQKRGLRGLMEGRRLRERAGPPAALGALGTSTNTNNNTNTAATTTTSFNTVSSSDSAFAAAASPDQLDSYQ